MDYTIDTLPSRLTLGRQTETGVNDIRIDMSEWLKQWPELAISIWPTRPGETAAYPAVTVMDGNCVIWRVNSADTAIAGNGTVEIMGVADGKKALSKVMTTYIPRTTTGVTTEPPEAAKPWVDSVAVSAAIAQEAAQRAENAAGEIKGLSAAAQTLEAGQAATATYADGVLVFGIPAGERGIAGEQGPQGEPGRDGTDAEVTAGAIRAALGYEPADAAAVDTKLTEPAEGLAVGKYFRVAALDENGHAVLEAVDAKDVGVQDVQVAGASVVADGVADVPVAAIRKYGVVKIGAPNESGLDFNANNSLTVSSCANTQIDERSTGIRPIVPTNLDYAVKTAMCDGKGAAWTADEQAAARERFGIPGDYELIADVITDEETELLYIDKDNDGTDLMLVKAIMFIELHKYGGSLRELYIRTCIYTMNESGVSIRQTSANTLFSKSYDIYARTDIDVTGGILSATQYGLRTGKTNSADYGSNFGFDYDSYGKLLYINKVGYERYNANSPIIPAGTRFKLYGVRA